MAFTIPAFQGLHAVLGEVEEVGSRFRPSHVAAVGVCPLCRAPTGTVLQRFGSERVTEFFVSRAVSVRRHEEMRGIIEGLWGGSEATLRRCAPCDFAFADPFVAGSAEFYAAQAPDTPYPREKWEYRQTLAALTKAAVPAPRVLDVGGGKGHFLAQLIAAGWRREDLFATEYSAAGRAAIEAAGIECFGGDVRDLDRPGRFDAICMFQVLEHLDGYETLFAALERLAAPGARLFIAVPNGARIALNERLGLLPDYPPNHISRWSAASMARLAEHYGWQLAACETEPAPSAIDEMKFSAINRFLRNTHDAGWAQLVNRVAERYRRGRLDKVLKAAGMVASPDVWLVSARAALSARPGGVPHALWAELRRAD